MSWYSYIVNAIQYIRVVVYLKNAIMQNNEQQELNSEKYGVSLKRF